MRPLAPLETRVPRDLRTGNPVSLTAPVVESVFERRDRLAVKSWGASGHRWELPGNYPVFTVVMVIYHYVERIWRILVTPICLYNIYDH